MSFSKIIRHVLKDKALRGRIALLNNRRLPALNAVSHNDVSAEALDVRAFRRFPAAAYCG